MKWTELSPALKYSIWGDNHALEVRHYQPIPTEGCLDQPGFRVGDRELEAMGLAGKRLVVHSVSQTINARSLYTYAVFEIAAEEK